MGYDFECEGFIHHVHSFALSACLTVPLLLQEAYSVARQFNLIPPVCEQAEYHFFQRDKVEVQLPELYHKIGMAALKTLVNVELQINARNS